MSEEHVHYWAAIWPDGTITRGACNPPRALPEALDKTNRCVGCLVSVNKDDITDQLHTLKERWKNWGSADWKSDDPGESWEKVRGNARTNTKTGWKGRPKYDTSGNLRKHKKGG